MVYTLYFIFRLSWQHERPDERPREHANEWTQGPNATQRNEGPSTRDEATSAAIWGWWRGSRGKGEYREYGVLKHCLQGEWLRPRVSVSLTGICMNYYCMQIWSVV